MYRAHYLAGLSGSSAFFFWGGGGRVHLGEHFVEDHYLHKKRNFTGKVLGGGE